MLHAPSVETVDVLGSWFLTDGGVPGNNNNANVDGSTTPVVFSLSPELLDLQFIKAYTMFVIIEDAGNVAAEEYGNLPALTSGVRFQAFQSGVTTDLDAGVGIVSNADWASRCYDMQPFTFGAGNNYIAARWSFANAGRPLLLRRGDRLDITIQDDLDGLVTHRFSVHGLRNGPI